MMKEIIRFKKKKKKKKKKRKKERKKAYPVSRRSSSWMVIGWGTVWVD